MGAGIPSFPFGISTLSGALHTCTCDFVTVFKSLKWSGVDLLMTANLLSFGLLSQSQQYAGHERGSPWLATRFLDF